MSETSWSLKQYEKVYLRIISVYHALKTVGFDNILNECRVIRESNGSQDRALRSATVDILPVRLNTIDYDALLASMKI